MLGETFCLLRKLWVYHPQSLTVAGHKTICQIGALETGKTTIMYLLLAAQADDRVQA
jgi:hypothetical protein